MDDEYFEGMCKRGVRRGLLVFIVVVLLVLLCSCRTQYVPVETVKTEYITNNVHDSVYVDRLERDSIFIEKKNDTVLVYRTKLIYQDRWKERIINDTILKVDSIQVPYPVERKLNLWERVKTCWDVLGFVCIVFVVLIFWKARDRI